RLPTPENSGNLRALLLRAGFRRSTRLKCGPYSGVASVRRRKTVEILLSEIAHPKLDHHQVAFLPDGV
ncbi:MAG: hypothetical protein WAZ11_08850, partial [Trichococcus flocculiformis]